MHVPYLGKTLTQKEKAIRIAKKRNQALEEDMIETNEVDEGNDEIEEDNLFSSGFGGMNSDTDDSTELVPIIEDQKTITKENDKKKIEYKHTKKQTSYHPGWIII